MSDQIRYNQKLNLCHSTGVLGLRKLKFLTCSALSPGVMWREKKEKNWSDVDKWNDALQWVKRALCRNPVFVKQRPLESLWSTWI